jgi:hypothetical protein
MKKRKVTIKPETGRALLRTQQNPTKLNQTMENVIFIALPISCIGCIMCKQCGLIIMQIKKILIVSVPTLYAGASSG